MNDSIETQLAENGFYVSTTVGVSMRPMLRNRRDRIILRPVGEERLCKWDLPLYRRPDGKYVLHRIIGVEDGYYIIRGDNTYAKEKVPEYVRFVDGFPMNEAGKIQKYKMREQAVELLGLQDAAAIETA